MSENIRPMKRVYIELAVFFGCVVVSAIIAAFVYQHWNNLEPLRLKMQAPKISFYTFLIATPVAYALSHALRHVDCRL